MSMMQGTRNDNVWPGSQLQAGKVFFWGSASESGDKTTYTIFSGRFEGHGKTIEVPGGTVRPAVRFSDVRMTTDFGKTWTSVDAQTFSSKGDFFTNKEIVAQRLLRPEAYL